MSEASPNNNVKPITSPGAATIQEAVAWIGRMAESGLYPSSTARFRISAIENLCSILSVDEPRTAQWVLAHIEEIAHRWATRNNANPNTTTAYLSRARGALEDFLAFLQNPQSRPRRASGARQRKQNEAVGDKSKSAPTPGDSPPVARPMTTYRTFPIGKGESIEYRLPETGITVRDALKFAIHLATMATNFDVGDQIVTKILSLARAGDVDQQCTGKE